MDQEQLVHLLVMMGGKYDHSELLKFLLSKKTSALKKHSKEWIQKQNYF
jgi:hypothetical protein